MIQIPAKHILRFLDEQYPALLLDLQEENQLGTWIAEKTALFSSALGEAEFFHQLSRDLGVSAYLYIKEIMGEDFSADFQRLQSIGVLKFEIINVIQACGEVFALIPLSEENENNRHLRLAVTGVISDYLYQSSVA